MKAINETQNQKFGKRKTEIYFIFLFLLSAFQKNKLPPVTVLPNLCKRPPLRRPKF